MTKLLSIYNPSDATILRGISRPVTQEDRDSGLVQTIIDELLAYSDLYPTSVGFSAIQFGHPLQIFFINCRPTPNFPDISNVFHAIVINPMIHELGAEMFAGYEGCMSIVDDTGIPKHRWRVPRRTSVIFDHTDEHGVRHSTTELRGFTAVIFQHEYDHLQGLLIDQTGHDAITNTAYLEKKNAGETNLYLSY